MPHLLPSQHLRCLLPLVPPDLQQIPHMRRYLRWLQQRRVRRGEPLLNSREGRLEGQDSGYDQGIEYGVLQDEN
jgi:hypothetical protein